MSRHSTTYRAARRNYCRGNSFSWALHTISPPAPTANVLSTKGMSNTHIISSKVVQGREVVLHATKGYRNYRLMS